MNDKIEQFIKANRKTCWESDYENGEYCIGENKVKQFLESIPMQAGVKVNFAEEMYKAIKFTLDYDKREIRENDDYEVSFLYPANNLSYQKLLKAVKMYEDSKISA